MTREANYLIECVSAVMQNAPAPALPDGIDLKELVRLAARQSIANILCYALEGKDLPDEISGKLRELKNKAILREATQEMELRAIRAAFTERGIKFMPLKGVIIKHLYPTPDMRSMGDIDFLFDPARAEEVREIMQGLGYEPKGDEDGNNTVDVYWKKPIMNIEMHRALIGRPARWAPLFADAWERAEAVGPCEYAMTKEEFYVFLAAHFTKHYVGCGTGIRSVLDLWVYRTRNTLDEAYLAQRFDALGLSEFVKNAEALGEVWFGGRESTPLLDGMAEFVVSGGTYGEKATLLLVNAKDAPTAKREYFLRRLFPPRARMQILFPVLEKTPVLLPFCWLLRLVKTAFDRKTVQKELHLLGRMDNDRAVALQELHKRVGLRETYDE